MQLYLLNGTFENGCTITILDKQSNKIYIKLVYKDSIEINNHLYFKEDITMK